MGKIQRLYAPLTALVRARHLEAPEKMRPFEFSPLRIFPALVIIIIIIIIIRLGIFFVLRVQSTQNVGFNHLDSAHTVHQRTQSAEHQALGAQHRVWGVGNLTTLRVLELSP